MRVTRRTFARQRAGRAFAIVEVVIAATIFVLLAGMVTLALGRAASNSLLSGSRTLSAQAVRAQLQVAAHADYLSVVTGTFTRPQPCPDSRGASCVTADGTEYIITYSVTATAPTGTPANCTPTTTPAPRELQNGLYLTGCTSIGNVVATATTRINSPHPGWMPGVDTVHVTLNGNWQDLPTPTVFLAHPGDGVSSPELVAMSTISDSGNVDLHPPAGTCTPTNPCVLTLGLDSTPTVLPDDGQPPWTLTGPGTATGGVGLATGGDGYVATTATVQRQSSIILTPAADGTPNPTPGSVCVWATFPTSRAAVTTPACNTGPGGTIRIDTYDQNWGRYQSLSGTALTQQLAADEHVRYPIPPGVAVTITIDNPNGTCPYAPGMLASSPGDTSNVAGAPDDWAPLAVCSSYTWGIPTEIQLPDGSVPLGGQGGTLTTKAGQTITGTLNFDNETAAPGAAGYGNDPEWLKPRSAAGCSTDQTCLSALPALAGLPRVTDTFPNIGCVTDGSCATAAGLISSETAECPESYCYSAINAAPAIEVDETIDISAGGTFSVSVADPDDSPGSVTLTADSPTGTSLSVTPAGTVGGVATFNLVFSDSTGDTSPKIVTLTATSGDGPREHTTTRNVTLYYTPGPWKATLDPGPAVTQGGTGTLTVTTYGTDGQPMSGVQVTVTSPQGGVSAGDATTGGDGTATIPLGIADTVPAGQHTLTATITGTGIVSSQKFLVLPTVGAVTVTDGTVTAGSTTTITADVTDLAGDVMPGAVVRSVVIDTDSTPARDVYPESVGCTTGSSGSCTLTIRALVGADPGTYTISAGSGAASATPGTLEVTP